jgi:hypothetical protein
MINETKVTVEKLVSDGSNWVTYWDCMMWTLQSWGLLEHLTNTTITATYQTIGTVKNVTPEMRWDYNEGIAMQIITALIPISVFTSIKGKAQYSRSMGHPECYDHGLPQFKPPENPLKTPDHPVCLPLLVDLLEPIPTLLTYHIWTAWSSDSS